MKNVNKTMILKRSKASIFGLTLAISSLTLSACSSNKLMIAKSYKNSPEVTQNNMTDAISCMGNTLQKGHSSNAFIFLVRNINDGTVKDSVYQDGPLSDAGRIQMINVLSDHLNPKVGLVTDTFPLMFTQTGKERLGLNRFGLPSLENQQVFMQSYTGIIQNARKLQGITPASNIVPLIVSGSFTRFDSDNLVQKGTGQNVGSRTKKLAKDEKDTIWRRTSGQIDIGNTSSAKALSLVINLIDPRTNLVVSSQSLDLVFNRTNKTFKLRVGIGEGYYGISKSNVVVEGVHGAQKVLIDAAALWLINKAYGSQNNFSSCFSQAQKKITLTSAQIDRKTLARQQKLVKKSQISSIKKNIKTKGK